MTVYAIQSSFVRGELSPKLRGRVDVEQYGQGAADLTNWLVTPQGGVERRPGTIFISAIRDETEKARLVEFEFNEEQAYCVVINDATFWFATLGGLVVDAWTRTITGVTKANPAVVTYSGTDVISNGDKLLVRDVAGMVQINNRVVTVANLDTGANTFECSGLDSSSFTTYASGGSVRKVIEVAAASYTEGILFDLQFAQVADTLYIADDGTAPAKLVRSSEISWTLSTVEFEDGPWLEEKTWGTTLTPASTGSVIDVDMTSNSTSSYTAADDDSSVNAYKLFDRDLTSALALAGTSGWASIDFPSTDTKVADAYWLTASSASPELMPTHWIVEGYTGSAWVTIDGRAGETAWAPGERRYYEMTNVTAYQAYRLTWYAVDGGESTEIAEWTIHRAASDQTAFNLTASSATGINTDSGFQTTDVGRAVRLMGTDGIWRWARIIARTSITVVTIRLYFHALLDLTPVTRWQLSSFSASDGYPCAVAFFQDRLVYGGTVTQPRTIFASESADYESHHLSDPVQENDAIAVEMTGNQLSAVTWIEEMGDLIAGTGGALRSIGPAAQAEPFSSFNVRSGKLSSVGSAKLQPIATDTGLLYADRYRRRLVALRPGESGGYVADDISWWSDHLLKGQVIDVAFQEDRNNVAWLVMEDGSLVACTYLPEFGVVAFVPVDLGGTDVVVESAAAIPSSGGAGVYLIVKRTVNGATRRYLEYFAPRFETGDTLANAVYLDCAYTTSVTAAASVSGLTWLIGATVGLFINGVDVGDAVVSSAGVVTLPGTTTGTVTIGLRYTSRLETLRAPTAGNRDGSSMGRQMAIKSVALDLLNAKGLRAGSLLSQDPFPHADRAASSGLDTGVFPYVPTEDHATNNGVVVVTTDKAYPATIRALIAGVEGAP